MANIEFKTLEQFMPYWCQKILPAVYDDSLSYYQLLGRILQKYNEVIEIVNKHSETLADHENRITAAEAQIELNRQAIEALKAELAKLDEQVKQNTANIVALTERVNGHDEAIQSLRDLIAELQQNNRNWRATVISNHDMLLQGTVLNGDSSITTKIISFDSNGWGKLLNNGNGCFPLKGTGASVGMVALKIERTADTVQYPAFGFLIEDNDLHFFTATYTKNGTQIATNYYGATDNWTEVELLDITNIKQSLGSGEYDTISQKVLTQLINSKLNQDMGITGATAGQYINIATVDSDGKPLTFGFGTPGGGGSGVDVVQTTGQSTTSVMSQDATTKAINAVKTTANIGIKAANMLATTIVYPTTAGGTNGKFVGADDTTFTREQLLASLMGADGTNTVFTVKKTGATSWDRITWFKASAGVGLYDFAWYETDGTNAKAGVDRLTMATNGQFAVSEQSSVNVPVSGVVQYKDLDWAFYSTTDLTTPSKIRLPGSTSGSTSQRLKLPAPANTLEDAYQQLVGLGGFMCKIEFVGDPSEETIYHNIILTPHKLVVDKTIIKYYLMGRTPMFMSGGAKWLEIFFELNAVLPENHNFIQTASILKIMPA